MAKGWRRACQSRVLKESLEAKQAASSISWSRGLASSWICLRTAVLIVSFRATQIYIEINMAGSIPVDDRQVPIALLATL